jgi:hypothetical protein
MERIQDPPLSGRIDPPPGFCAQLPRDKAEREAVMAGWFERPGSYTSQWRPDLNVLRETSA